MHPSSFIENLHENICLGLCIGRFSSVISDVWVGEENDSFSMDTKERLGPLQIVVVVLGEFVLGIGLFKNEMYKGFILTDFEDGGCFFFISLEGLF